MIQTGSIKTVSHHGWPLIHCENTAPPLRPNRQAFSVPRLANRRQGGLCGAATFGFHAKARGREEEATFKNTAIGRLNPHDSA
jgi:hypothetical protein